MNAMDERWLPVVGYEGAYEVSDRARVRSVPRTVVYRSGKRIHHRSGKILAVQTVRVGAAKSPYRYVHLSRPSGKRMVKVANLMLEAFVGPKPFPKAVARHLDDNSLNDVLGNLAWGTHVDNVADAVRNERRHPPRGEDVPSARLTEADVLAIRAAVGVGATQRAVAKLYGVHFATISDIVARRTWRHI